MPNSTNTVANVLESKSISSSPSIDAAKIPSIIATDRSAGPNSPILSLPKLYPYCALQPLQTVACGKMSLPQKGHFVAMETPPFDFTSLTLKAAENKSVAELLVFRCLYLLAF